jgi:hypothetical protein
VWSEKNKTLRKIFQVPLRPQEASHKKRRRGIDPRRSGPKCIASVLDVLSVAEVSVLLWARYVIVTELQI